MRYMIAPKAYADKGEGPKEEPLSVMQTFALCFPAATLVTFLYSVTTESLSAFMQQLTFEIAFMVLISAFSALALNFLGGFVLKDLGASAQQIVGKLNTICIAAISVAFLGEHLPPVVVIGTMLVLSGVVVFEQGQHTEQKAPYVKPVQSARARHDAEVKRLLQGAPTS